MARRFRRKNRVTVERVDNEAAEDVVRKVQRLKKALVRCSLLLADEAPGSAGQAKRVSELSREMKQWEEQLEAIRCDLADLLAERDRWRIAHDKLRERIDHHTMEPRSEPDRRPQSARQPVAPRVRSADESQDFTAIDKELERLNPSMRRAFSSE